MALNRPQGLVVALLAALVAALAVAGFSLTTGTASAQVEPGEGEARGISVAGEGSVSGRPDVLRFTVGVEVTADTVDAALTEANETAQRMIGMLRQRGVAEEDLQTASVQVHPRYGERGEQISGYVVGQDLQVKVTDLAAAGGLITAAVEAGGDAARLSGLAFALEDNDALLAAAREQAYAKARAKAEQYARLAGKELADVVWIAEDVHQSDPMPFARAAAEAATADVPIVPGSTEVSVRVEARWEMR
jgi:uncharacterized protein YggE